MKISKALVGSFALCLAGALGAEPFEGRVSMKIDSSNSSKEGPQSIEYEIKDGYMRMEMATARGQAVSIIDFKNQQVLLLMPQQRMYMVQPLPKAPQGQAPQGQASTPLVKQIGPDVQMTTEKDTILGYDCTKIIATSAEGTTEAWVTEQLGQFIGLSPAAAGPGRRARPPQAWESALKGKGFFPMRVVTTARGKGTFRLDVTKVEKVSVPDSDFAPPDGWQKFDIASMMGRALPGGLPGARPADNN
jgi:hypothetical protein